MDGTLFENPPTRLRGAPFWAWNCEIKEEFLEPQIEAFRQMGMGGYHIHCRTGLKTSYLSDEFMKMVKRCVQIAREKGMYCYLYDEDRYSSGFCGGMVSAQRQFRARHLVITSREDPAGTEIARYDIALDAQGCLARYARVTAGAKDSGLRRAYAYLVIDQDTPWYNNQSYVDTLNPKAIRRFVELTHERYHQWVGEDFGTIIPAIFCDEPKFTSFAQLAFPWEDIDVSIPYTDDLPDTYLEAWGTNVLDTLPEVIWELPEGKPSLARYRYHDHVAERFTAAFADTVGAWCEKHNIALTGHMMGEPTLQSQTAVLGEVMRSFRSFQIPGIDMLRSHLEYTTAKQAQSAAHQYGRSGMASEIYGVTGWDFDFRGHRFHGDWQAALGVTLRIHHLAWMSMAGEGKRDYPAAIGWQSPWYKEYHLIEDHFARLNAVLSNGKPVVRVGIIHPVESMWLCWGPMSQTAAAQEELEESFRNAAAWSLFGLIDFDFICESLLPKQSNEQQGAALRVGEMAYDAVVVPGMRTMRASTLVRLESFLQAGGKVIFLGQVPALLDGKESDAAARLATKCVQIPMLKSAYLTAMEAFREVDIRLKDGTRPDNMLYQLRQQEDGSRVLFIAHGFEHLREGFWDEYRSEDMPYTEQLQIVIKGHWKAELLHTDTGARTQFTALYTQTHTKLTQSLSVDESLLLHLKPGKQEGRNPAPKLWKEHTHLPQPLCVTRQEPNVCLLDIACWQVDGGSWHPREELLRIETALRNLFAYPAREEQSAQPWTDSSPDIREHMVRLRFEFFCEADVNCTRLALEDPESAGIILDGYSVNEKPMGFYIDEAIRCVALPPFVKGNHELVLEVPFGKKSALEYAYLLGDFGVRTAGDSAVIMQEASIRYGDVTRQGLPFYGGNLVYRIPLEGLGEDMMLEVPHFRAPVITVALDGKKAGSIAHAPYRLHLGMVNQGPHMLEITVFGNRFNTLGQLHNWDAGYTWIASCAWRTKGTRWGYEYNIRPFGLLTAPRILRVQE